MPRYLYLLILFLSSFIAGNSQPQTAAIDSMKKGLAGSQKMDEKVYWLDVLSRALMNVSIEEAEKYGKKLIETAEESRDRKLMVEAYLSNGTRCSYFASNKEYVSRSIDYYNKALDIARQNRLDDKICKTLLRLSAIHLAIPDKEKALSYVNQASSLVSTLKDDSLTIATHTTFGNVYLSRNDKILALRDYLTALRLSEEIRHASLIRDCNAYLSNFYSSIEDYDKAIDYQMKAFEKLDDIKEKNAAYQRAIDLNNIGNLYAAKKSYDIAISYYERSLAMADSLKFPTLKVPAYVSLLNQFLRRDEPKKALDYFNSPPGHELREFLRNFGFSSVIDHAFGVIYSDLGTYDSAVWYFQKARPYFENATIESQKMNYYAQLASLYKKMGNTDSAINLYMRVKNIAERIGSLESSQAVAKQLDSLYSKTGNYQLAIQYNSLYYKYKDSIQKINKENELTQVEAADEQLRQQRIAREREEAKRKRFNIQYLAITIGITALFVALVMLGMFKVSRTTIKMIGFFAFIMFFEFIFLIFKKNITSITDGEPWKDLLFMIGLAALLLPLHHWLEHKVIHYLTSHNRLTEAGQQIKTRLFNRKKAGNP